MPKAPNEILTIAGSAKMPAPMIPLMIDRVRPGTPMTRFKPSSVFCVDTLLELIKKDN